MPTYIPGPGVLACKVGDETVLLDTVSGSYFRLDDVSGWVWEEALRRDDLGALAADLAAACSAGSAPQVEQIHADVAELVADLVARGLLSRQAG